jgi:hypothetical protein
MKQKLIQAPMKSLNEREVDPNITKITLNEIKHDPETTKITMNKTEVDPNITKITWNGVKHDPDTIEIALNGIKHDPDTTKITLNVTGCLDKKYLHIIVFSSSESVDNVLVTRRKVSFPTEIQDKPQVLKLNLSTTQFKSSENGSEIRFSDPGKYDLQRSH